MIKANMDINRLTLGKFLGFCGQFVGGRLAPMMVNHGPGWKVIGSQSLGINYCVCVGGLRNDNYN